MEVYVGTSGWLYEWNEGASLEWYAEESGLNAVELNASFYRFPFRNQVASWSRKGRRLRWSIKVHRSITHLRRLDEKALETWGRFHGVFNPMEGLIDFYLFQMPPGFTCHSSNLERVDRFHEASGLGPRMAVEFRHESCFNEEVAEWGRRKGIVVVSIDAPIASWIVESGGVVYLRMHGRTTWYGHEYTEEELRGIAEKILSLNPVKAYVFFNNNHWMLENARSLLRILGA
ncbi:DUF72 domain-containing protein [Desulfurococcus mucosus]|uniref:DUF72 domain-containing protein n=1 Tax=Desulfurococcus mucosus (strain ATCC 35584 / DSM 2162 / JCM 9187 / O7/1) TaxID=765177 RepID=E8R820_DESM0|nr:DUF72 domain-containing protein [Desulfurococcus mucosus]ADV64646.1 protein of unknown function DUF72 [Desulfurococcus mucosus DSM 2162]